MSSPLEEYLRDIAVQLHELPQEEREDQIEEIRAHLVAYAQKRQADGASEDKAERAAIVQFGEPSEVGRKIARSIESRTLRSLRLSASCGLVLVVLATFLRSGQPGLSAMQLDLFAALVTLNYVMLGFCLGAAAGKVAVQWAGMFFGLWILITSSSLFAYAWRNLGAHSYLHWGLNHDLPNFLWEGFHILSVAAGAGTGSILAHRLTRRTPLSASYPK